VVHAQFTVSGMAEFFGIEPGTYAMMFAGVAVFGMIARRRMTG
jgi:hypothetical protein